MIVVVINDCNCLVLVLVVGSGGDGGGGGGDDCGGGGGGGFHSYHNDVRGSDSYCVYCVGRYVDFLFKSTFLSPPRLPLPPHSLFPFPNTL